MIPTQTSASTPSVLHPESPSSQALAWRDRLASMVQRKPWLSALLLGLVLSVITVGTIASAQSRSRSGHVVTTQATGSAANMQSNSTSSPSISPNTQAPQNAAAAAGAGVSEGVVNINTATEEELQRLPGIGPSRATAIVALRTRVQRFRGTDDLLRIRGIGRVSFRRLRPFLTLTSETTLMARPGRSRPRDSNESVH